MIGVESDTTPRSGERTGSRFPPTSRGRTGFHVALLTAHLSEHSGGLAESVPGLARALNDIDGIEATIVGLRDPAAPKSWRKWGDRVLPADPVGPRRFGLAPYLTERLRELAPDLVDVQGLWMYHSIASLRHHRNSGTPYLVTPRGMLDPWALRRGSWKKRLVGRWFEDAHLANAACIRALNEAEASAIRACGLANAIAVVPNGVELPEEGDTRASEGLREVPSGRRLLLFLGRMHSKKGIFELVEAWRSLGGASADWHLLLAGWDDGGHLAELQRRIREGGLSDTVTCIGPRFGAEKRAVFEAANAFILPSHSEGLPMAVLEAWSYCLPVIMTPQCNLPEGFAAGAAIEVAPEPPSIASGIRELVCLSREERRRMGRAGRQLVEQRYAWPRIARQMRDVYAWVLGGGPPPSCVMTD